MPPHDVNTPVWPWGSTTSQSQRCHSNWCYFILAPNKRPSVLDGVRRRGISMSTEHILWHIHPQQVVLLFNMNWAETKRRRCHRVSWWDLHSFVSMWLTQCSSSNIYMEAPQRRCCVPHVKWTPPQRQLNPVSSHDNNNNCSLLSQGLNQFRNPIFECANGNRRALVSARRACLPCVSPSSCLSSLIIFSA